MHLDNKQQRTTRTQHAGKLVHRHVRVCHVIQVVDAGNDIKGIVRKRHLLHTCLHVDHIVCICAEQPVLARKWVHAHALNRRLGPLETSPRTAAHVQKLFAVVEGGVNAEEICVDLLVVGVAHGSMFPLAHRLPVIHLAALLHWILLDCNTWLRNTQGCAGWFGILPRVKPKTKTTTAPPLAVWGSSRQIRSCVLSLYSMRTSRRSEAGG